MLAIPIYPIDCLDFSTNGTCLLQPTECMVEETANGLYELSMELPIEEDGRFTLVTNGAILKVVCPVRESPLYEADATGTDVETTTVTRHIYRVNTSSGRLHLRQKPSGKVLSKWKKGTEVTLLSSAESPWYKVSIVSGGATGYMHSNYLVHARDVTETITKSRPVTQKAVKVEVAREQLFRVYSVETDTENAMVTVKAMHIFYDLRGSFVNRTYEPENGNAQNVLGICWQALKYYPSDFSIHYERLSGTASGAYSWKNGVEMLLDPDEGIVPQTSSCIFRDNFDVYIIPDETRDMGVTVRRGKNLLGVTVTVDDSEVVTAIQPCGKDKDGNNKWLRQSEVVTSPNHYGDYPFSRAQKVDYPVKYDKDYKPSEHETPDEETYTTEPAFWNALERKALEDFEAGCDLPSYSMDVDFVLLENTEDYSDYARLQAVHLFDTVTVIDELIGLQSKVRVTAYKWNVLTEQYDNITLGDLEDLTQTNYSYNLASGSVSGTKIVTVSGSVGNTALADGSVTTGKLANGSVTSGKLDDSAKLFPYPVGAVYSSVANDNPSGSFGGTWVSAGSASIGGNTVYYWRRTA